MLEIFKLMNPLGDPAFMILGCEAARGMIRSVFDRFWRELETGVLVISICISCSNQRRQVSW